jgi:hypothetical protein
MEGNTRAIDDLALCGDCQQELDESASLAPDKRSPCPRCGSLTRILYASARMEVRTYVGFKLRQKRPGVSGYLVEHLQRREVRVSVGDTVEKLRVIDRENDRYLEKVTAEDGTVLHETDEHLSEHRGHGSAKFSRGASETEKRGEGG